MSQIRVIQPNQNHNINPQNIDTTTTNPVCKYCDSKAVVKFGTYKGVQRYWCKACNRKFKGDDTLFHMKVPPEQISAALSMYYSGMSINEIRTHFKQENGSYPSSKSVYGWIQKYTDMAVNSTKDYTPKVGNTWIADETYIRVDKSKANVENPYSKSRKAKWVIFWDIIDADTRFLLASHLTSTRNTQDAQALMEKAAKRAGKVPKVVVTDKLAAYLDGIELAYGADSKHKQGSPFDIENNTNLIERFHGTLKERTKVMRALKNKNTLQQFSDGWLVHYNYFKPHMSLEGKSPAEKAGINYQYRNWAEMIRQPVANQTSVQSLLTYRNKINNAYKIPKAKIASKAPRITKRTPKISKGVFTNKQGTILSNHSFRGSRRIG